MPAIVAIAADGSSSASEGLPWFRARRHCRHRGLHRRQALKPQTIQLRAANSQDAGHPARAAFMRNSIRRYCLSPSARQSVRGRRPGRQHAVEHGGVGIPPVPGRQMQPPAQHGVVGREVAAVQPIGVERLIDQQGTRDHLGHDDE